MGRLTNILRRWFPGAVSEGVTPGNEEEHVVSRVSAGEEIPRDAKRVDVVSDTHGRLSSELVRAIKDADLVIYKEDADPCGPYARPSMVFINGQQVL